MTNKMNRFRFLLCLLYIPLLGQSQVKSVEGLFYIDQQPVSIEFAYGLITKITRIDKLSDTSSKFIVAPGFIDHQVNGYLSHSFVGEDITVEKVREITEVLWKSGVTTYLPTLTTSTYDRILKGFSVLTKARMDPQLALSIPGYHLEGPYISPIEGYRGAHDPTYIRKPDWDEFSKWNEAADNRIMEITVAPELEGAMEFIRRCRQKGVTVALGHHNGSAANIQQAVDAGASVSTHLGNGCANSIHRHENPLWPQLSEDRLVASLIADGFHLRPEEVNTFFKVKGVEKTVLVSDVISTAGLPPGTYQDIVVTPEGKVMMPSENVLAGASFLIHRGIENVMTYTQCSLADAVRMASQNVAELLDLDDRGEIRPGKRADLVLFEMDNNRIEVKKTILAGKIVFEEE